jgi:hypothetical protein
MAGGWDLPQLGCGEGRREKIKGSSKSCHQRQTATGATEIGRTPGVDLGGGRLWF